MDLLALKFMDPGADRWADGSQNPNAATAISSRQSWQIFGECAVLMRTGHDAG